jgi:SNF2 family DNA or RNA helicase
MAESSSVQVLSAGTLGGSQIEPSVLRKPLPHQTQALEYCREKERIALFMEMRLGKSLVAVRWAKQFNFIKNILLVAPLTVLAEWENELIKELVPKNQICTLLGTKNKKLELISNSDGPWFLINYEGLRSCQELITEKSWDMVILDESTRIKNPSATTTKLIQNYLGDTPFKAILSGLPNPEDPSDFFEQFKFLNGQFMQHRNFWHWRNQYFNHGGFNWFPRKGVREKIKEEVHNFSFIRTKKQCKVGSKKIYSRRYAYMTPNQKTIYNAIEKDFAFSCKEGLKETKWSPVKYSWLAQVAGGILPETKEIISTAKLKVLLEILKGELKDEKVVVWFRFNSELEYAEKLLVDNGISCRSITGSVLPSRRANFTKSFRESTNPRVMLAQVKCCKFGVDWSVASAAIYFSNPDDMEGRAQSEDRIIHSLKTEPVIYLDLVTKDTVDEDIVEALREKNVNSKSFLIKLIEKWKERQNAKAPISRSRISGLGSTKVNR